MLAPLTRAGLIPADAPLTINAVSGYSGGGKGLIAEFEGDALVVLSGQRLAEFRDAGLDFAAAPCVDDENGLGFLVLEHEPLEDFRLMGDLAH